MHNQECFEKKEQGVGWGRKRIQIQKSEYTI